MRGSHSTLAAAAAAALLIACRTAPAMGDGGTDAGVPAADAGAPVEPDGGSEVLACDPGAPPSDSVARPVFVRNLPGQTGWFAPPVIADLTGDGTAELVVSAYDTVVYAGDGPELGRVTDGEGRVYPPTAVADLEPDGRVDLVIGRGRHVFAYDWRDGALRLKAGWPKDTTVAGSSPEVRGLSVAELGGKGPLQIIATTTQTTATDQGGAQVFVWNADGKPYHPSARSTPDWPRYNNLTGAGNDADRNAMGHVGYACYGLNVAVGQLDDDAAAELVVTYDNHRIQLFEHDGVAVDVAPQFTNPFSEWRGQPLTWGQMTRWADPATERAAYQDHARHPSAASDARLQWTQSPPTVVDLDGDGRAEVVSAPNIELGEPYQTVAFGLMVLEGNHGDGSRSGVRKPGWETLPRGATPISFSGYYPPLGVPAIAPADLDGDGRPELVVSLNDGFVAAYGADASRRWRVDVRHGRPIMFAAEPVIADMNQDGSPEIVIATYGAPTAEGSGFLMILGADGRVLQDLSLPNQRTNGNGIGAASSPAVGDLDGDGALEIAVQTFDHGVDVFTVPGSGTNCLPWPTARGGPMRQGRPLP